MNIQDYISSIRKRSDQIQILLPDGKNKCDFLPVFSGENTIIDGNNMVRDIESETTPGLIVTNSDRVWIKNIDLSFNWVPWVLGVTIEGGVLAMEKTPLNFDLGRVIGFAKKWEDPAYSFERTSPVIRRGDSFYHKLMRHKPGIPVRLLNSRTGNRSGIEIKNSTNITITNCKISNYGQMGIGCSNVKNLKIERCIITKGRADGIHLKSCRDIILEYNQVLDIGDDCINIYGLMENSKDGMSNPMQVDNMFIDAKNISSNYYIHHNVFNNTAGRGMFLQSPNGEIEDNIILNTRLEKIRTDRDRGLHQCGPGAFFTIRGI